MALGIGFYLINIFVAATALLILWRLRMLAAFSMLLYLSALVLVRPAIIYIGLDEPQPQNAFSFFVEDAGVASLVAALWVGVFLVVVVMSRKLLYPLGAAILPRPPERPPLGRVRSFTLFVVGLGVMMTLLMIMQTGGVARFMFAVKVEKALTGAYVFRQIAVLGIIISLYGLFHELKNCSNAKTKRKLMAFYGCLIIAGMATNFAWGNRGNIAYVLVAAGIGWNFYISRLQPLKVLTMALILLATMTALGTVRKGAIVAQTGVDFGAENQFREISRSLHFVEFDALVLAVRDSGDKFEFRLGEDFKNGALSMVPRSILPNRENFHVGQWFRQIYQPGIVNGWPVTVIGDWWVNFGVLGVFIGAALSGVVAGIFDGAFRSPTRSAWDAVMAPCLGILSFSGGFGTGFPQEIIMTLFPIALFAIGLRVRFKTGPAKR